MEELATSQRSHPKAIVARPQHPIAPSSSTSQTGDWFGPLSGRSRDRPPTLFLGEQAPSGVSKL